MTPKGFWDFSSLDTSKIVTWTLTRQLWSFWNIHLLFGAELGNTYQQSPERELKLICSFREQKNRSQGHLGGWGMKSNKGAPFGVSFLPQANGLLTFRKYHSHLGKRPLGQISWCDLSSSHHTNKVALTPLPQGEAVQRGGPGGWAQTQNVCPRGGWVKARGLGACWTQQKGFVCLVW